MTATGRTWLELNDEVYGEYDTTARKGVNIMDMPVVVEIEVYDDDGNRLNMYYHAPITGWKLGRDEIILTTTTDNGDNDGTQAATHIHPPTEQCQIIRPHGPHHNRRGDKWCPGVEGKKGTSPAV